jgi:hypothetical protein
MVKEGVKGYTSSSETYRDVLYLLAHELRCGLGYNQIAGALCLELVFNSEGHVRVNVEGGGMSEWTIGHEVCMLFESHLVPAITSL